LFKNPLEIYFILDMRNFCRS